MFEAGVPCRKTVVKYLSMDGGVIGVVVEPGGVIRRKK